MAASGSGSGMAGIRDEKSMSKDDGFVRVSPIIGNFKVSYSYVFPFLCYDCVTHMLCSVHICFFISVSRLSNLTHPVYH